MTPPVERKQLMPLSSRARGHRVDGRIDRGHSRAAGPTSRVFFAAARTPSIAAPRGGRRTGRVHFPPRLGAGAFAHGPPSGGASTVARASRGVESARDGRSPIASAARVARTSGRRRVRRVGRRVARRRAHSVALDGRDCAAPADRLPPTDAPLHNRASLPG